MQTPERIQEEHPLERIQEKLSQERIKEEHIGQVMGNTFGDDLFEPVEERSKLSHRDKLKVRHKEGMVRAKDKPQTTKGKREVTNMVFWKDGILRRK